MAEDSQFWIGFGEKTAV